MLHSYFLLSLFLYLRKLYINFMQLYFCFCIYRMFFSYVGLLLLTLILLAFEQLDS